MLDKNELEDLLVKLRLGTISIESAITEIEQNFYSVDENENISIWQKLECPFDEVLECDNLSVTQIENHVAKMIKNNTSFILVGLSEEALSEISAKYSKCKAYFEAGIIKYTAKEKKLDTDKKILKQTSINNYINMMISKNNEHYIPSILIWLEKNNYQIENISRIVCLIKFDNNDYLDKNRLNDYIISKIKDPADFNSQDIISYFGDNEFILIKSFDKKQYGSERSILNKFFLNLKNSFDNKLGLNFKASCGAVSKNINEISSSYEQAKFVLNWNQYSNSREVFFIEDYILEFYISVNDQSSLKMILRNILKIIKNNSNFKETIITMSKYNMSIAKTSSKLSVHRNTIVYRMKKIKEMLNLDPINNNIDRIKFHIISILLMNNSV